MYSDKMKKPENHIIPGCSDIEDFTKQAFASLTEAIRTSNTLPQEQAWDLYTAHPAFVNVMDTLGNATLKLMSRVLQHQGVQGNIVRRDMEEKLELLVDANDMILERIGSNIDEIAGIKKNPETLLVTTSVSSNNLTTITNPGVGSWNTKSDDPMRIDNRAHPVRLLTAKNIQRPQATFKEKVDNRNDSPFTPHITEKPNSRKPLALFMEYDEDGTPQGFAHPYDFELEYFKPSPEQLTAVKPILAKDLAVTPLVYIETVEALNSMLRDLKGVNEFAVDLEHHSYRTFQGITCLMQISTRTCDYIIDTLALRDNLHILNEVFTKPSIVKVFHGADSDILWLQRDLALYVVNMFDTHQGAKQLGRARLSLAFQLNHYCNVNADKHFQLADWRIRPLPEELTMYARQDTHYLLYIYDMMKNELIAQGNGKTNILEGVIQRSTEICKTCYIKPRLLPDSHLEMYRKSNRAFDNRQLFAFRELYRWRDATARQEDESLGYVLPNHMLLQIAESLPREMQGILACCNPIPPLVRQNLVVMHHIVLKAREQSIIKPILEVEERTRITTKVMGSINLEGPLHCPHDLSRQAEFRDDLPTLLGSIKSTDNDCREIMDYENETERSIESCSLLNAIPKLNVFETPDNSDDDDLSDVHAKLSCVTFLSPYDRYKIVRPYAEAIEERQRADEEQASTAKLSSGVLKVEESRPTIANTVEYQESYERVKQFFNEVALKATTTTPVSKPTVVAVPQIIKDEEHIEQETVTSLKTQINQKKRKIVQMERNAMQPDEKRIRGSNECDNSDKSTKSSSLQDDPVNFGSNNAQVTLNTNQINQQDEAHKDNHRERNKKRNRESRKVKRKLKRDAKKAGFEPFDYAAVNFNQFQGGSVQATKPVQVNSKFKGKGKNNRFTGKSNNQSFTFNSKMGGRGGQGGHK